MLDTPTKSIWDLPEDVIEQILPEIELHRDLINFACTSHLCRNLVIPRHTEYRLLRIEDTDKYAYIWTHLSRRPDLASTIREIFIDQTSADEFEPRVPTSLIQDVDLRRERDSRRQVEQEEMIQSLGKMYRLKTFCWDYRAMNYPRPDQIYRHFAHEVFDILHRVGSVEHFHLNIIDLFKFNEPVEECGLWKLSQLRSLSIIASNQNWLPKARPDLLQNWFNTLSSLEFLNIPVDVLYMLQDTLFLPSLKRFRIEVWHPNAELIDSIMRFIEHQPHLEELSWYYRLPRSDIPRIAIPSNFLPNLRQLECQSHLLRLMITQPGNDSSLCRKLEGLRVFESEGFFADLCTSQAINHLSLRHVSLNILPSNDQLQTLALAFPNIEEMYLPLDHDLRFNFDELTQVLAQFEHLKVLNGPSIWSHLGISRGDEETDLLDEFQQVVTERIGTLAQKCPNLVKISHPKIRDHKYLLCREDGEVVARAQRVSPRSPFETFYFGW